MSALVSVIIPVAPHHAAHAAVALASVAWQTVPQAWLDVRVVSDTERKGASWARNQALAATSAPLALFLDADDYLPPRALEQMLRGYARSRTPYVYGDWWVQYADGRHGYIASDEYDRTKLFGQALHTITTLIETDVARQVGGFDEDIRGYEDWEFWLRCASNGVCGERLPIPAVVYRFDEGRLRNWSWEIRNELFPQIRSRYRSVIEGTMCGCGRGNDLLKEQAQRMVATLPNEPVPDGLVRLEYTGENIGAVGFRSPQTGQTYRGGRSAAHRFVNAPPDDVGWLLNLAVWRVVPQAVFVPPPVPVVDAPTPVRKRGGPAAGPFAGQP